MVLPVTGFLPVPLPMMIPFMGAQSLVIGKMFGEGFQYGKRKISAMPNEEFNKLTFENMMSNAREELKASIPTMQAALQDMTPLVETIITEFTEYLSKVLERVPEVAGELVSPTIASGLAGPVPIAAEIVARNIPQAVGTITSGTGRRQVTQQVFPGQRFERTLTSAQKDVTISRGTGIIATQASKRFGGQSQRLEKARLEQQIVSHVKQINFARKEGKITSAKRWEAELEVFRRNLVNLLARYRF